MRVGLISFHTFSQPGGVKRHVLGLYKEFKRRGIKTKIIVPRRNWRENYGQDVILLGTSFPINFVGSRSDLDVNFNSLAIERTLRKEKFDVLHFHNFSVPSALQILTSPSISNTLNVLTLHSNVRGSKFLEKFPTLIYLFNKICQWKIDGVIGVAPLVLETFKNYKGPKILIPNGVDLEEFNPKVPPIKKFSNDKTSPEQSRRIDILFVGRIEEKKGLIYLLKAYKILEKKFNPPPKFGGGLRLIIIGEGDLKKECQDYVKENNLKEVHFEGKKVGRELVAYYNSCDIFCSPAIFGESFGIVLLEAMACGKPVVAFANEGYKEFLAGKKGEKFLAKPKDFKELAQKLEILIKNPKLRKEMGEWGKREAQKYSWSRIADKVLTFYQICQKEKKKKGKGNFSLEKILTKLDKALNQDILEWLKNLGLKV